MQNGRAIVVQLRQLETFCVTAFARLTPQQERIVLVLAEARLSNRLPRDSFGIEQRDGQLSISAPEPLSVEGDIQDLFPIQQAGYVNLRREQLTPMPGSLMVPETVWIASITATALEYYKWHHTPVVRRLISTLRPTDEDTRRLLYSPVFVGAFGAIAGAITVAVAGPLLGPMLAGVKYLLHMP